VSKKDVGYLFDIVIRSCIRYIPFVDDIYIVTPEPNLIKGALAKIDIGSKAIYVLGDDEMLSEEELALPGWVKQQIIKLRSYKICNSECILCVGADTVLQKRLLLSDFYNNEDIIIHYRKHDQSDSHYVFEQRRVENIYKLLGLINSENKQKYDYIFDVFMFNSDVLKEMELYAEKELGGYRAIYPQEVNSFDDMVFMGEWSLYAIFVIEILKKRYQLIDGTDLVDQIHSQREFNLYKGNPSAIHFVKDDFDKSDICKLLNICHEDTHS